MLAQAESYLSRYDGLFSRSEPREHFRLYIEGLMSQAERKNCWQMAEEVGLEGPQKLQRLLTTSRWDVEAMLAIVREIVAEELAYDPGIGVLDESGFPKEGHRSVGVQRQYCGRLGKVDNCQVGVFLGYITPQVHALIDRRLYLPEKWSEDGERRTEAGVPEDITFQTKIELAQQMLAQAWSEGLPMQWVLADTAYGRSSHLRQFIDDHGRWYVMEVPTNTQVWVEGSSSSQHSVADLAAYLLTSDWETWSVPGEKGAICYQWTALRVMVESDTLGPQWLLARRRLDDPDTLDFFLSNAPPHIETFQLFRIACGRHRVEDLIKEAKSHVGLADYEVRDWTSWHRHTALSLVALLLLNLLRLDVTQKKVSTRVDGAQCR